MSLVRDRISANEKIDHDGDLHVTGSIGKGAVVKITGNLTVDGDVENEVQINLPGPSRKPSSIIPGVSTFVGSRAVVMYVKGNIADNVAISGPTATLKIDGSVGEHCTFKTPFGSVSVAHVVGANSYIETNSGSIQAKALHGGNLKTFSGNIVVTNVREDSILTTHSGDISVETAANKSSLKTFSGKIVANHVMDGAVLNAHSGIIQVANTALGAELSSFDGQIYISGVKQRKPSSASASASQSTYNTQYVGTLMMAQNMVNISIQQPPAEKSSHRPK